MKTIAATAITIAVLLAACGNNAAALTKQDKNFLAALHNDSIPVNDERATINEGHYICANVKPPTEDGTVSANAVDLMGNVENTLHLDWKQAVAAIVDAGKAYCPGRVG